MDSWNELQPQRPPRAAIWGRYALLTLALIAVVFLLSNVRREKDVSDTRALSHIMFGDFYLKGAYLAQGVTAQVVQQYQAAALKEYRAAAKEPVPAAIRRYAVLRSYLGKGDALSELERLSSKEVEEAATEARTVHLRSEVAMWRDIYGPYAKISAAQTAKYKAAIDKLNLGPARPLALRQLYLDSGDSAKAGQVLAEARSEYSMSLLAALAIGAALFAGGLFGVGLIAVFIANRRKFEAESRRLSGYCEKIHHSVLWVSFLVYMTAFLVMSIVVAIAVAPLTAAASSSRQVLYVLAAQLVASVASGATGLATLVYLTRLTGGDLCAVGLTTRDFWQNVGWGIMGYASLLPIMAVAALLSSVLFRGAGGEGHPVIPMLLEGGMAVKVAIFLLASVFAPFFEEIFFRGILYNALRARLSVAAAVVISAAAFAIIHPQLPAGFLPIFAIGAVFAVLFETRKSLVPSMVAHSINNTVVLLITILAFS